MTPKERVHGLFEGHMPDRVPIYFSGISSRVASSVLGRDAFVGGGMQQYREVLALWQGPDAHAEFIERTRRDSVDLGEMFDVDLVRCTYWRYPLKPAARLDEYTFAFGSGDAQYVMQFQPEHELFPVIEGQQNFSLEMLEQQVLAMEKNAAAHVPAPEDLDDLRYAEARVQGQRALYGGGIGIGIPYEPAWYECMMVQPDLVERLLEAQQQLALKILEAHAALPFDLKLMFGGGDLAAETGLFFSPQAIRRFHKPRFTAINKRAHELGLAALFASDGALWDITDDLFIDAGFDGFYEIDRLAGMDMRRLAERYPRLVRLGGIASRTVHLGTHDDIRRQADDALQIAREFGHSIVGVSNQVVTHTPPDNFLFMMEYLRDNR